MAENAGWDRELLAVEFRYLSELDIDLDLTITGFETPEIDILLDEFATEDAGGNEIEGTLEPSDGPAVTRPGDLLFQLIA